MIYVCYEPTVPGTQTGDIVQFTQGKSVKPELLPWPSVEDPDGPRDYKLFTIVDGQIVAKA